jgi:hypothetical protein
MSVMAVGKRAMSSSPFPPTAASAQIALRIDVRTAALLIRGLLYILSIRNCPYLPKGGRMQVRFFAKLNITLHPHSKKAICEYFR